MQLTEADINFSKIDWKRFEELCFDLLIRNQFHSLLWRQGGPDKGRDIEAQLTLGNSIIGPYTEKWFIECKQYSEGVGIKELIEKVEWARAENPNHLLIITSSYLTQSAREWVDKIKRRIPFQIHLIEGKRLKELLLAFPDLVIQYFYDDYHILLRDLMKQWVCFDTWPEPKIMYRLHNQIEPRKLGRDELAFFYAACCFLDEGIKLFSEENGEVELNYNYFLSYIAKMANSAYPIKFNRNDLHIEDYLNRSFFGRSFVTRPGTDMNLVYISEVYDKKHLQISILKENKRMEVLIATREKR